MHGAVLFSPNLVAHLQLIAPIIFVGILRANETFTKHFWILFINLMRKETNAPATAIFSRTVTLTLSNDIDFGN